MVQLNDRKKKKPDQAQGGYFPLFPGSEELIKTQLQLVRASNWFCSGLNSSDAGDWVFRLNIRNHACWCPGSLGDHGISSNEGWYGIVNNGMFPGNLVSLLCNDTRWGKVITSSWFLQIIRVKLACPWIGLLSNSAQMNQLLDPELVIKQLVIISESRRLPSPTARGKYIYQRAGDLSLSIKPCKRMG